MIARQILLLEVVQRIVNHNMRIGTAEAKGVERGPTNAFAGPGDAFVGDLRERSYKSVEIGHFLRLHDLVMKGRKK